MTREFDRLITDAAPGLPDCGPDRRAVRMLLHSKPRRIRSRSRLRPSTGALVAASLAVLVLLTGTVAELGSDAFEFESQARAPVIDGQSQSYVSRFGSTEISASSGSQASAYYEAMSSRQYEIVTLLGTEIDGMIGWTLIVRMEIDGAMKTFASDETLPSSHWNEVLGKLKNHLAEYEKLVQYVHSTPPLSTRETTVDGIPVVLRSWEYEIPDIGTVRYHIGKVRKTAEVRHPEGLSPINR